MSELTWRGIYAVLVTPFNDDLSLDPAGLARQVEFCIERGAAGIVAPVVASEFYTLSDAEREDVFRTVGDAVDGRLPYVAGVSGVSAPHAARLAAAAVDAGADAVLAMPPYMENGTTDRQSATAYYAAIARSVPVPIVLQNAPPPIGAPLANEDLRAVAATNSRIVAIKEETSPNPHRLGDLTTDPIPTARPVFGGLGGIYLFNELSRGASGTMPACQFVDVMVGIFERYGAEDLREARRRFNLLLPALVMERLYGVPFMKTCLKRRGVIDCTKTRVNARPLDPWDLAELDHVWTDLEPLFS